MNIEFNTNKLRKACSSEKVMRGEWGVKMARKLMQRLADLEAVENLGIMTKLPGRCHELKGARKGQLALDLAHPRRLVFEPNHNPIPLKPDGGLDWKLVTSVLVLEVSDYH